MPQRTWSDQIALLLGQWFYTGRSKYAPGTVGSLFTLPLFWAVKDWSPWMYWGLTLLISLVGVYVSDRCARLLNDKDPSSVVIDEVAGVLIALGCVAQGPYWLLGLAWCLFRLLDITKPWLIDQVQYLKPPGLGIMADDLLAGACAGFIAWTVAAGASYFAPLALG